MIKRKVKEIKLKEITDIDSKYGTVDRDNPKVIYLYGKCWITPISDGDYNKLISFISNKIRKNILHLLLNDNNNLFSIKFIFNMDVNTEDMKMNYQKYLSFSVFFKQGDKLVKNIKNKEFSDFFKEIAYYVKNQLNENDFQIKRNKQK